MAALRNCVADGAAPWTNLVALVDRALRPDSQRVWRLLLEFWHTAAHDAQLRKHSRSLYERYRAPMLAVITEGVRSGAFTPAVDPDHVVTTLVATLDGIGLPQLFEHPYYSYAGVRAVVLAQLHAVLVGGYGPPAE